MMDNPIWAEIEALSKEPCDDEEISIGFQESKHTQDSNFCFGFLPAPDADCSESIATGFSDGGDAECTVRLRELLHRHNLTDALTSKEYGELYQLLLSDPKLQPKHPLSPPLHHLNLADGTLNLETMELYAHTPHDGFFHYLNLKHDELCHSASGPVFERFTAQVGDGDTHVRQQLLELVALAITGYEAKYFYVLLGPSNTGKTQFGRFLAELVGRENVESISGVHDFSNRFTTSALTGKRLGVCLDLPDAPLPAIAVGTIKQFVGDDSIKVEAKYKTSKTAYEKPLLLFAGNHPIRIPNVLQEQALLNRMITIPFSNPIAEQEMQQHLYTALLKEAPYIVSCAIEAYRGLMQNNFVPTHAKLPAAYMPRDSREGLSALTFFLDAHCAYDEVGEVSTDSLYRRHDLFADQQDLPRFSKIEFGRLLAETFASQGGQVQPLKRCGPESGRGYRGIRLRGDLPYFEA